MYFLDADDDGSDDDKSTENLNDDESQPLEKRFGSLILGELLFMFSSILFVLFLFGQFFCSYLIGTNIKTTSYDS